MKITIRTLSFSALMLIPFLAGCSSAFDQPIVTAPQLADHTQSGDILAALPPARQKVVVSVYEFQDQTGQMKENDNFATYSRAVTQGGISMLNKALLDVSHKGWFTVIERNNLKDLLQERQIIKITRSEYKVPGQDIPDVKPMLYAGIIIEGGIVSYESNIVTGGGGAKYLGVGGDTQYRRDIVTIYLRAVSTQTGEVLLSVNTSKTIYSTAVDASIFKYVSFDKLLEVESGFTLNEPPQFAVRQAIEMGIYSLVMEGVKDHLWEFANPVAGNAAMKEYLTRTNQPLAPQRAETPASGNNKPNLEIPNVPQEAQEIVKPTNPETAIIPTAPLNNTAPRLVIPDTITDQNAPDNTYYLPDSRYLNRVPGSR